MGSEPMNSNLPANEPELHLLLGNTTLEEPLYKSLFRGLDDFFFPKKLPPLKLESKPEPVKSIWESSDRFIYAMLTSYTGLLVFGAVFAGVLIFLAHRVIAAAPA